METDNHKNDLELRLKTILRESVVGTVLPDIAAAELTGWWLAGGAVRNSVWQSLYGADCRLRVNDFDIAFYDPQGDRKQELRVKNALESKYPHWKFDVKNQASFAVWRPGRRPYTSVEDGVGDWLHTATSVGVRLEVGGDYSIFAPYGLEDLFNGVIRPTPEHVDCDIARAKADTFLAGCAMLKMS